jgi:hypothetical protein
MLTGLVPNDAHIEDNLDRVASVARCGGFERIGESCSHFDLPNQLAGAA